MRLIPAIQLWWRQWRCVHEWGLKADTRTPQPDADWRFPLREQKMLLFCCLRCDKPLESPDRFTIELARARYEKSEEDKSKLATIKAAEIQCRQLLGLKP